LNFRQKYLSCNKDLDKDNPMQIEHKIAVVTGGASGMGKACVASLRERGVRVLVWDLHAEEDELSIVCDVSDSESVEQAMHQTMTKVGTPAICINCAGIAPAQRMVGKEGAMPLADFKRVIDINLVGTFNVMRVMAEAMMSLPIAPEDEERGVIINTASIAAFEGQVGQLAYSASKGGVVAMTLPAARELAQQSIRVNAIAPGLIATPLLLTMPQMVQESLASTVPFPKRFGRANEFAALVIHILENTLINGEVIRLDGALRMQAR
jgi:NAD(P)-dependent dehydrogenase (short-subunit alcohol dehydrogenase family)